eukprot:10610430-Ditylum_brightwellii.AAC.1
MGTGPITSHYLNLIADYDSIAKVQMFLKNLQKVEEHMDILKWSKCVGPIFFYIIMEILSTMSAKTKRTLITCIKKLSFQYFNEEDIDAIVISIYKICSVEAFQCLFLTLNDQMRISGKHPLTLEEVRNIAECNYRTMKLVGEWDGASPKALLLEDKGSGLDAEKAEEVKCKLCTGLQFQPLAAGRSDWRVFCDKVMLWCNTCPIKINCCLMQMIHSTPSTHLRVLQMSSTFRLSIIAVIMGFLSLLHSPLIVR